MRAVILDMPQEWQEWIDERHRLDLDRKDEMWECVLHVVPPASSEHNALGARLMATLLPVAVDLDGFVEPGVFDPAIETMTSYRVADLAFARAEHVSARGIEGEAALVIEILSPADESYEKLPFYRRVGVNEVLYIDPRTRQFEVRCPQADGWEVRTANDEGWVDLVSIMVSLRTVGGRLQVRGADGVKEL